MNSAGRGLAGMRLAFVATSILTTVSVGSCAPGRGEPALRQLLDDERAAHLAADASRLAAHMADTVWMVDAGQRRAQTRQEIEDTFRSYFAGVTYHAWEDVEDPLVRIASDGSMAWVVRRVRSDRTAPRFGGLTKRESFESAWTATYGRSGATWQMTSVTSTFAPESTAARVLEGSRRIVGGEEAVARLAFARFRADAAGPDGSYQVVVHSTAEGQVKLEFSLGFAAGIRRDDGWVKMGQGAVEPALTDTLVTFIRGHDLLMNALRPELRFGPLRYVGEEEFGQVPAIRLDGADALGAPIRFYYAQSDTMPLGFQVVDHLRGGDPVATSLMTWERHGDLLLPAQARIVQGSEVFDYEISEIEIGESGEAGVFDPPI